MAVEVLAAVTHEAGGDFALERLSMEAPRPGEVLVRVKGVGICHTDIIARDGLYGLPYPLVLGHEGSGIIADVGEGVTKVQVGDPVVISFNSCGECTSCSGGAPAYCANFSVLNTSGARADGTSPLTLDGEAVNGSFFGQSSFATYAMAFERNVVKVDADLPLEILGPLGCGIQTGAGAVINTFDCPAGSSVLALGAGPVGLAAVLAAVVRECGAILVLEPIAARRELALELGATHAFDPAAGDLAEQVRGICPSGVDYVLDTTGQVPVLEAALGCLAKRGSLGIIGTPQDLSSALSVNLVAVLSTGLTIKGISEGDSDPERFIPELLALFREGRFPFDRMIRSFPLSEINSAVGAQLSGDAEKAVLVP